MSIVRLATIALFSIVLLWTPGCSEGGAASDAPDGFFQAASTAMEAGEPVHMWRAMPESYRSDVDSVIQDFAGKMDADVWNKGFSVAKKVTEVLDKQRDLILANPMLGMLPVKKEEIEKQMDGLVVALSSLANSEISTLDGLKGLDLDDFMSDTLSEVFAPLREAVESSGQDLASEWMSKNFKTSVVSEEGDNATIKVEVEGKPAEEHKVVRVDGVWIPEELANGWKQGIEDARKSLADLQIDAASKMQFMTGMAGAEEVLNQLLAAKDADEFNQAVMQAMQMFGEMGG